MIDDVGWMVLRFDSEICVDILVELVEDLTEILRFR